ncbi:hypothetical protein K458DRAFT_391666 [Lentithecium fluviatile CBS 122367]|uniref:Uncharacterized protein n=1 Tax=Lentithecium fluviatile CBS 122367 TaxID=1168545 RepID=A0A6G1ITZ2_9PLEO|nr:hypothetical protein K458DRAFT_391666 [Lentithecium fluviatile CBS 122367]
MAPQPVGAGPALDHMPKEMIAEYQELVKRQNQGETEFKNRVSTVKAQLFEKHESETHRFWTKHPWATHGDRNRPNISPSPALATVSSQHRPANPAHAPPVSQPNKPTFAKAPP